MYDFSKLDRTPNQFRAMAAAQISDAQAELTYRPAPLLPEVIKVTSGPVGAATVYGSWDRPRGMQWIGVTSAASGTGHTEALRTVSGDTAMHPAGWPAGEWDDTLVRIGRLEFFVSPLKLTASDLSALELGLESFEAQADATERRYGRGSVRGLYGNGY